MSLPQTNGRASPRGNEPKLGARLTSVRYGNVTAAAQNADTNPVPERSEPRPGTRTAPLAPP